MGLGCRKSAPQTFCSARVGSCGHAGPPPPCGRGTSFAPRTPPLDAGQVDLDRRRSAGREVRSRAFNGHHCSAFHSAAGGDHERQVSQAPARPKGADPCAEAACKRARPRLHSPRCALQRQGAIRPFERGIASFSNVGLAVLATNVPPCAVLPSCARVRRPCSSRARCIDAPCLRRSSARSRARAVCTARSCSWCAQCERTECACHESPASMECYPAPG